MDIAKQIAAKERIENNIRRQVNEFLTKLDAAGEWAPTVTKVFGGGNDDITEIAIQGDNVVLSCSNYFRGDVEYYSVSYPIALVDSLDSEAIAAYAAERRRVKEEEKVAKAKAEAEETRERELRTLAKLSEKYKDVK